MTHAIMDLSMLHVELDGIDEMEKSQDTDREDETKVEANETNMKGAFVRMLTSQVEANTCLPATKSLVRLRQSETFERLQVIDHVSRRLRTAVALQSRSVPLGTHGPKSPDVFCGGGETARWPLHRKSACGLHAGRFSMQLRHLMFWRIERRERCRELKKDVWGNVTMMSLLMQES
ncbi:hypothetical protein K490DRAFT_56787 [Saccharata proteae CBS 121410]|uniref:Uncharacterized protein n=1 Tax=Saccharata proteae CBS 121410 TaxID=1314787 RepID=A0A9P4HTG2_9PEZI|nr:hypothetical protein K490DRAFT_56787 [Saccharata proteae CBS 121410]